MYYFIHEFIKIQNCDNFLDVAVLFWINLQVTKSLVPLNNIIFWILNLLKFSFPKTSLEFALTITFNLWKLEKCLENSKNCLFWKSDMSTICVLNTWLLYCIHERNAIFSSQMYHKLMPSKYQIASYNENTI